MVCWGQVVHGLGCRPSVHGAEVQVGGTGGPWSGGEWEAQVGQGSQMGHGLVAWIRVVTWFMIGGDQVKRIR